MYRVALVVSLLFLSACASETEQLAPTPVRAEPQPSATSLQDGLAVRYYYGTFDHIRDLEGFMQYKDGKEGSALEVLRHEMGKGRVLTSESDDLVGAFITGYLHLEETGIYHFQVTNNDGVRLQLGGARIYDDPRTGPARTSPPIPVDVMEPGWYALEIWYFEKRGTATLDILWSPPGDGDFIEVPITAMKHQ
jgi:hypothetical protein